MKYKLLSVGHDAKTIKGQKKGYLTGILYMAPHTLGGGRTLCPFSTAGCRAVCLYTAGRGVFNVVQQARIRKTQWFLQGPGYGFMTALEEDIKSLIKEAKNKGMIPAVRLNGTTDIKWEDYPLMWKYPELQFYDYTKYPPKMRKKLPDNYHLTFSFSEAKHAGKWSEGWRNRGVNTAVVFSGGLPKTFTPDKRGLDAMINYPVIDGDLTDLRFTDPQGVIVGLKTKGKARGVVDAGTGFVQLGDNKLRDTAGLPFTQ